MEKSVAGRLAATVAVSLVAVGAAAVPADAAPAPKRGQAKILLAAYQAADRTGKPIGSPAPLAVVGGVRYADGAQWKPRRGALVYLQKRTSSGKFVSIGVTRTPWSGEAIPQLRMQPFVEANAYSIVTTPAQRVLRVYVPGNATYAPVYSAPVVARGVVAPSVAGVSFGRR